MKKKSTFTKVSRTDNVLYGPRKLLICGFPLPERSGFLEIMKLAGIEDTPKVWVETEKADESLKDLFMLPDMTGFSKESEIFRAIIMAGITQKELHLLMGACRNNGMPPALWAVLTPTSEKWTLRMLLKELESERCKMREKRESRSS